MSFLGMDDPQRLVILAKLEEHGFKLNRVKVTKSRKFLVAYAERVTEHGEVLTHVFGGQSVEALCWSIESWAAHHSASRILNTERDVSRYAILPSTRALWKGWGNP
jgi:hypothetical protein